MDGDVRRGSCLCGAVRYEVEGPPLSMGSCHCRHCRKQHGAAFATYAGWPAERLRLLSGQESLRSYASSPRVERRFCGTCGSSLFADSQARPGVALVALGTMEDDPGIRNQRHIFVASKVPWHEIRDGAPQFETYPPGVQPG